MVSKHLYLIWRSTICLTRLNTLRDTHKIADGLYSIFLKKLLARSEYIHNPIQNILPTTLVMLRNKKLESCPKCMQFCRYCSTSRVSRADIVAFYLSIQIPESDIREILCHSYFIHQKLPHFLGYPILKLMVPKPCHQTFFTYVIAHSLYPINNHSSN